MRCILGLVFSLILPNFVWGTCAPERMVKVVFRDATPGLDPNAFAAKPKVLYRLGTRFGRLEESADPALGIHGLMITSEPDLWMINLATKTGKHMLDPGEPYHFHAPILAGPNDPEFLKSFEFGCELAYMKAKSVAPEAAPIETRKLDSYRVTEGNRTIFLAVDSKLQKPVAAALYEGGRIVAYLKYLSYDANLEPDLSLFEPPSGVKMSESK